MYTQLARSGWGRACWDRQEAGVTHCTLVIWLGGVHKPKGARVSVRRVTKSPPKTELAWGSVQRKTLLSGLGCSRLSKERVVACNIHIGTL